MAKIFSINQNKKKTIKIKLKVTGLPFIQKLTSDTRDYEITNLLADRTYEIKLTPYYNGLEGQTGTLRISTGFIN